MKRSYSYILFVVILTLEYSLGLIYFLQSQREGKAYVGKLFKNGIEYIMPENKKFEFGDSDAYNKTAYSLLERGNFYNPVNQISAWVTPGYPLFLALIYYLFGYNFFILTLVQALLLTTSYYLTFCFATKIFSITTGWITLALLLINVRFTAYIFNIYTEVLFLFFISLTLYLIMKILLDGKLQHYSLLGLILGYTFLVRPVILPSVIIILVFLLMKKIAWKKIVLVSIIFLILPGIWIIRNYMYFGRFIISTNSEITLSSGNLNLNNFNFFERYRLSDFIANNELPSDSTFINLLNENVKYLKLDTSIIYPQDYIYESVGFLFKNNKNSIKWTHPYNYMIRTAYLFKVSISPYTHDMSKKNRIISLIIWLLTLLPGLFSIVIFRKNLNIWFIYVFSLSLLIIPSMNIIDSNLRYQLPTQFVISLCTASLFYKLYSFINKDHSNALLPY